jgi:hypothetical protein
MTPVHPRERRRAKVSNLPARVCGSIASQSAASIPTSTILRGDVCKARTAANQTSFNLVRGPFFTICPIHESQSVEGL